MAKRHGKKKKDETPRCKYCEVRLTKMYTMAGTGGNGMKQNRDSAEYWTCTNSACAGKPKDEEEEE